MKNAKRWFGMWWDGSAFLVKNDENDIRWWPVLVWTVNFTLSFSDRASDISTFGDVKFLAFLLKLIIKLNLESLPAGASPRRGRRPRWRPRRPHSPRPSSFFRSHSERHHAHTHHTHLVHILLLFLDHTLKDIMLTLTTLTSSIFFFFFDHTLKDHQPWTSCWQTSIRLRQWLHGNVW